MLVCNSVQDQWDLFVHMMDPDFINKLQRITLTDRKMRKKSLRLGFHRGKECWKNVH